MSRARVSRKAKMIEAMERLKLLGLPEELFGIDEENKPRVEAFEKEYNMLVYAVITDGEETCFFNESYLYVSDYKHDWEFERECLEKLTPTAYVYNFDMPKMSELGTIGIVVTENKEIIRTF